MAIQRGINYLFSLLRKRVKEKIIVIESDDWGLERALSKDAIRWMENTFGREKLSRWSTDCLESREDLDKLFSLLEEYREKFYSPPVITANFITHNVGRSKSGELIFRPISDGFFSDGPDIRPMYFDAIRNGLLMPQYHGFTHYNTDLLKEYNTTVDADVGFANGFLLARSTVKGHLNLLHGEFSSLNSEGEKDFIEGMKEFERFFGFRSQSLIPPTYIFDRPFIKLLAKEGIKYLQSANRLVDNRQIRWRWPLLRKRGGVIWGLRNARLDPHPDYNFGYEGCLRSIQNAFENKLPAVIDFHRVNFAGTYTSTYREKTLVHLRGLFDGIKMYWPDARFLSTTQLIDTLNGTQKSD
ncbi:MAG: hypothetical protein KF687_12855 [Cyclobacteriaceae bacterium]|nr:hypothetical protein [Cyclobacteriaceae bacterium]